MRALIGTLALAICMGSMTPATGIEPVPVPEVAAQIEPCRGEQTMVMEATAYCYGSVTKTGTSPVEGRTIAVDPEVIPLGSQVYVACDSWPEVDGVYIAEDTGGRIKGNIVDIYMADKGQCIQWGRRQVEIRIIQRGDL